MTKTVTKQLISPRFSLEEYTFLVSKYCPSQLRFISEVKKKLQDGQYKLEYSNCPCGDSQYDLIISEIDRYGLPLNSVLCMRCGTVRITPYLDKSSLEHFYTYSYQQMYGRVTELESYFLRQKSYGQKVLSVTKNFLTPQSWVCEIGCGAGGALKVFQDKGYNIAGCDYSNELIEGGKQKGVRNIYYGSLATIGNNLPDIKFDLIYLHHVFEHLNDPLLFLKDCREFLTPTGKIIIIVPDVSKIDAFQFPAGNLLSYLHIAHKYNFSLVGLERLCHRVGYSLVKLSPDPRIKTPGSLSSELWAQMTIKPNIRVNNARDMGNDMLEYLQETEKLYSLGLCKGQFLKRISDLSPKLFLSKLKRAILTRIKI